MTGEVNACRRFPPVFGFVWLMLVVGWSVFWIGHEVLPGGGTEIYMAKD